MINPESRNNENKLDFKKIEELLKEFILIMDEDTTNNTKLENIMNKTNEYLNLITINNYVSFPNLIIRNFLEKVSSWILRNFSSSKLNSVIFTISNLLNKLGFKTEIRKEEIINMLHIETLDELQASLKKETINYEEIVSNDSIISNAFLSAFYALIVTIANKPEVIIKSKNLLKSIITVMTQICQIDNISIYYKKKRLISVLLKILKELKSVKEAQESLITVAKLLMSLFGKIGLKRPIYRDYMFKKAVPDKISDIFNLFYAKDNDLVKSFSLYCFFSIRISDHKTYFWTKGVIGNLLTNLSVEISKDSSDEELIEYITLAIYKLTSDNSDIQEELIDLNFLEQAKQILVKFSKNNFIIYNLVSILRRIKDKEYLCIITEELLFTFFALFDYFYLTVKKEIEKNPLKINEMSNMFDFIILKELVAILGNIVKNELHSKPFIDKNLHLVLIDLKLSFLKFPKLVKNTIGALINLTTSNEIRENISNVAAFIQSIYLILETYKDNQAIIDYELKLINNVIKNDITIKIFISGDMFYYLLLFLKSFTSHDEIIFNCLKIIRTLILKKKGYNDFMLNMREFYSAINENKDMKETSAFLKILINELTEILNCKCETPNICIEVFLLISYISNESEEFKKELEKHTSFMQNMQKIITIYSNDEITSKLISQSIAQLPIEEFSYIGKDK